MVQNNKVLTVSYGTFSCTLEGFDDSFDTMKAIAEYFRDLAADDRYFGAEPPQPDAEMLARIAEREIARQVEARRDGAGIVLRAAEPLAAPVTTGASTPAPEPPVQEAAPEKQPEEQQAEAQPATPEQEDLAALAEETPEEEVPAQDVTAEVDEIAEGLEAEAEADAPDMGHVTAEETTLEAAIIEVETAEAEEDVTVEEETVAEAAELDAAIDETEEDTTDPAETIAAAEDPQDEEEALFETAIEAHDEAELTDALAEVELDEAPEMSETDVTAAEDDAEEPVAELSEAEESNAELSKEEEAEAEEPEAALATLDVEDADDALFGLRDAAEEEAALDAISARLADAETSEDDEPLVAELHDATEEDEEEEIVPAADSIAAKLQRIRAVVSRQERLAEDDFAEDEHAQDILAGAAAIETPAEPEIEDAIFTDLDDSDETEDDSDDDLKNILEDTLDPAPEEKRVARVIKVKQRDIAAAIAAGDMEEVEEETAPAPAGSLSPEDEEDLMRELAEVEAELRGHGEVAEAEEKVQAEQAEEDEQDDTATLPPLPAEENNGDDLARLMQAADLKLDDPSTSSNRETYSQLRGAVAAAQAERQAGGTVGIHTDDDPYREDLAEAVRPRRPVASGRSERARPGDRPAPLKLVAEQRVDTPAAAPEPAGSRGPIRPRRVAAVAEPQPETGKEGGFAAYAEEHGATSLADLLEAAAAYLAFVEGQEQFSRPQLMNKVRGASDTEFNREDGLRSFGQLLREGKIEKTGGGRFAASGRIGFRPDERAAG
ncbi:chemotaxis protein CheA [Lutimaribacter marinistellae]|uniref:Chemotaxis protein CheA n=1 Tax=Lutimaribacter marinistellae TaxID=1820329 RepID=A0ABV7TIY9_9RHOB